MQFLYLAVLEGDWLILFAIDCKLLLLQGVKANQAHGGWSSAMRPSKYFLSFIGGTCSSVRPPWSFAAVLGLLA